MLAIQDKPSGLVLSSDLTKLVVRTNQKKVHVAVQNQVYDYLFMEEMWIYGSELTVYDIAGIIEADMRGNGLSVSKFKISVFSDTESDSFEITALYCESFSTAGIDPLVFTQEYFLSSVTERRVSPEASLALSFYDVGGEDFYEANVNYRLLPDPAVKSSLYHGNAGLSLGLRRFEISVRDLREYLSGALKVSANEVEIVSFTVTCGKRYSAFYVDPSLRYCQTFIFRNSFNAWDFICLPALTSEMIDTDNSLALLGAKLIGYDWNIEKSYEVQSGPISTEEARLVSQLVASREINKLTESGKIFEVLVTDSECHVKDNDEPQSVKFTWRFADARPSVALPSDIVRIFTKEYNKIFS